MTTIRWANGVLDALFAPACIACRERLGPDRRGPACIHCWNAIRHVSPPWCDCCGEPLLSWRGPHTGTRCPRCGDAPPHFDRARAVGLYDGALRLIIRALKYQGHQSLGAPLGLLMRQAGHDLLAEAEAVVPVPLHPWRRLRRGFNQADELARRLGLPVWRPLRRRSPGVPQAGLPADQRRMNARDAYTLSWRWQTTWRVPRRVVLVDDVMTTGATLDACSAMLRQAGVQWIGALTAARAATTSGVPAVASLPPQPPPGRHPPAPRR